MEILIVILMLIFISLHLAKRNGENNYFLMLCIALVIPLVWIFAQSWTWRVVALYTTVIAMGSVRPYKSGRLRNTRYSTLTLAYRNHLIKKGLTDYPYSMCFEKELQHWRKSIQMARMITTFILCCLVLVYSYRLIIGEVWWKWLILAPVDLICVAVIVIKVKDFLDNL